VPAWREEACANLNAFVVDELSFAFTAAVEALDELLPAFNLSAVVCVCVLLRTDVGMSIRTIAYIFSNV